MAWSDRGCSDRPSLRLSQLRSRIRSGGASPRASSVSSSAEATLGLGALDRLPVALMVALGVSAQVNIDLPGIGAALSDAAFHGMSASPNGAVGEVLCGHKHRSSQFAMSMPI